MDEIIHTESKTQVWIDGMLVGEYPKIKITQKAADAIGEMMHDVFDLGQQLKADEVREWMRGL